MSSLAFPSENHAELASANSYHDSAISRPRYVVLQSLIGVMLACQLLSGAELIANRLMSEMIVGGLAAMVLCLLCVPLSTLQATWFSGALIGIDTLFVTTTIYLSGNARSDLYLSYFMLMLIAASVRRLSHVIGYLCCSVPAMASSSIKGSHKLVLCRSGICWECRFCW